MQHLLQERDVAENYLMLCNKKIQDQLAFMNGLKGKIRIHIESEAVKNHFSGLKKFTEFHGICTPGEMLEHIQGHLTRGGAVWEGYAPFCLEFMVDNPYLKLKTSVVEITPENAHLLHSGYEARNERELPVLTRWFNADELGEQCPQANIILVEVYSLEQMNKEAAAEGRPLLEGDEYDYFVINFKTMQDMNEIIPRVPITDMRNALGPAEGGSGAPINRDRYNESVAFWDKHAYAKQR